MGRSIMWMPFPMRREFREVPKAPDVPQTRSAIWRCCLARTSEPAVRSSSKLPLFSKVTWAAICNFLPARHVLTLSCTCVKLWKIRKLPVNWCNEGSIGQETPTVAIAQRYVHRFDVKGVKISQCTAESLREIVAAFPGLHSFHIAGSSIESLRVLSPAREHIRTMVLNHMANLNHTDVLSMFRQLRVLKIHWSDSVTHIPPLDQCEHLEEVNIYQCKSLEHIPSLGASKSLRKVVIGCSVTITDLSGLRQCINISSLDISWCERVTDISPIAHCSKLLTCNFSHCHDLADISPLSSLTRIKEVNLSHCHKIVDLKALEKCACLIDLRLVRCRLEDLGPLVSCKSLRVLDISFTKHISSMPELQNCHVIMTGSNLEAMFCSSDTMSDETSTEDERQLR